MSQEVGSPILQLLVAACQQAQLPLEAFLEGLDLRLEDLSNPSARLDWEALTIILDRILAWVGNDALFEAMMSEAPSLLVPKGQCQDLFPDVQTFFVWMVSSLPTLLHRNLQTTTRILEHGRILCEHYIPRPYRPCRALAIASVGLFRGAPRLFGLPDARVECTFDDRCGLYRITLPAEPAPLAGGVAEAAGGRVFSAAATRASSYLLDGVKQSPWFARLGQTMLLSPSLTELGITLEEGMRLFAGCSVGSLWILQAEGAMQCVHAWGSGGEAVHMLTSGTRIIGRAELPPEASLTAAERQNVQEMLDWASIAVDRILEGAKRSEPREIQAAFTDGLGLTARQRQVLFLLVQGLSDKEIAQAIGTSPKTIGHQVGILLRKGGVTCRTALANQCLTNRFAVDFACAEQELISS